ncbi:MAG TPA: DUF5666 domain-containing protein [Ideonella sp.]|uniref:DUF5666 domain-containing protein n=1 Tax=Ideonella sp. TaxID=1929293 RepID=UPI002E2F6C5F|nr:DUF5666 domain-containing protein [Ideonella sp.]HEX5684841.1 DUF5666 domain-containing protein [Ideonella sp.]
MSRHPVNLITCALAAIGRGVRRLPAAGSGAVLAAVLVACGGGGGSTPPDNNPPPAATSFTSGTISGFGSVIVNGVRFDDSSAEVVDDDGERHSQDDLELGAQVEIEASTVDRASGQGVATLIRIGSELVGPVSAVDVASQRLTVLGQQVEVGARTVFDDQLTGGLAGISVDQVLEVHARFDAVQGLYRATRIEAADAPSTFKLRGPVAALDAAGHTFQIGAATINYASAADVTPQLANGVRVRVRLQTTPTAGQWIATRVDSGEREHEDHDDAEMTGLITAWTSATQFSLDGLAVDARNAAFPDGQAGVVLGAQVEVEGAIVGGVLVATSVHVEDEEQEHERGEDYELHGAITAVDALAHTFTLRGIVVAYNETTEWRDLADSGLAVDVKVEVKGNLAADGTRLDATRISLED